MAKGATIPLHKCALDLRVPVTCRTLLARAVRFAVYGLLSIDDTRPKILGSGSTPDFSPAVVGGKSHDDEHTPFLMIMMAIVENLFRCPLTSRST